MTSTNSLKKEVENLKNVAPQIEMTVEPLDKEPMVTENVPKKEDEN